jgi:hypothetical protein
LKVQIEELLRVKVGGVYRHWKTTLKGDRVPLGLYRVASFPENPVTGQVLVCYRGVDGKDRGLWFVCSQADFAMKFTEEPWPPKRGEEAAKPPAEKTVSFVTSGS